MTVTGIWQLLIRYRVETGQLGIGVVVTYVFVTEMQARWYEDYEDQKDFRGHSIVSHSSSGRIGKSTSALHRWTRDVKKAFRETLRFCLPQCLATRHIIQDAAFNNTAKALVRSAQVRYIARLS